MAVYTFVFTIPANTSKTFPKRESIVLEPGILNKIIIKIPAGHCALAHMRIFYGVLQIYPKVKDTYFEGEDETLEFTEYFELKGTKPKLTFEGYNEDEEYNHSFYIRLSIMPKKVVYWWLPIDKIVEIFSRLICLRY